MDGAGGPDETKLASKITIKEAVDAFLEDEKSRHLAKTTTGQSQTLLGRQLLDWAGQHSLCLLDELTVPVLSQFRAIWSKEGNNANTSRRKHQRLSGFLWFCVRNDWLGKNSGEIAEGNSGLSR